MWVRGYRWLDSLDHNREFSFLVLHGLILLHSWSPRILISDFCYDNCGSIPLATAMDVNIHAFGAEAVFFFFEIGYLRHVRTLFRMGNVRMWRFEWTLSWRAHRQGECWFMCWFMPALKSYVCMMCMTEKNLRSWWCRLLIRLAVPIFHKFELSPLWRNVLVLLLLLISLPFCYLRMCMLRVASRTRVL